MDFQVYATEVEQLLGQCLDPAYAKQVIDPVNNMISKPDSMPVLIFLIQSSQTAGVPQMAAVFLRKRIVGHWPAFAPELQESMKSSLLALLAAEAHFVRHVVTKLAKKIGPEGQWNELFQFLIDFVKSENPKLKETGLMLFQSLIEEESIATWLEEHYLNLLNLFGGTLQDADNSVRIAGLKALSGLFPNLNSPEQIETFISLIPFMIVIVRYCIEQGDDLDAIEAFSCFCDLVESQMQGIDKIIPSLIELGLEVASNKTLEPSIRQKSLQVIQHTSYFRPAIITKNDLVPKILDVLFDLSCDHDDVDDDEYELSNHKFASQSIDVLANQLSNKYIFKPIIDRVLICYQINDPYKKRAALVSLAVSSEGCGEIMKEHLTELLPLVFAGMEDESPIVRENGCICLAQLSDFLQPNISEHHSTIMPYLSKALSDPNFIVLKRSCYAVESFCEHLENKIEPYLNILVPRLIEILKNVQDSTNSLQETTISAISATAAAACENFLPYFNEVLQLMKALLGFTDEHNIGLRARAIECIGLISASVGIQHFQPYVHEFVLLGLEGCNLPDQPQLREHTYGFFTNIAILLQQNFEPYLGKVLEFMIQTINSNNDVGVLKEEDFGGVDSDDDSDDESGPTDIVFRSAYIDEKGEAVVAIGKIATATKEKFLPYASTCMQALGAVQQHQHEDIRSNVMVTFLEILKTVMRATTSEEDITAKKFSKETLNCLELLIPIYTTRAMQDWNKEVVCASLECLTDCIERLGISIIGNSLQELAPAILAILQRKSVAQRFEQDDDDDENRDFELIDQALDTLTIVSQELGNQFSHYFPTFLKSILKFTKKSTDSRYREVCIGTVGELMKNQATDISPYFADIIEHALNNIRDENPSVRRNATYCISLSVSHSNDVSIPYFPKILESLTVAFDPNQKSAVLDNACGAIASLITKSPQNVPLDSVLPIFFSNLPLKEDFEEIPIVYTAIFSLFNSPELFSFIQKHIVSCLGALVNSIISPNVDDSWKIQISVRINELFSKFGNDMVSVVSTLDQNQQDTLKQILNK